MLFFVVFFVILRLFSLYFWMCMLLLTFPRVESAQSRDVREEYVTLRWTEGHVHLQGAPLGRVKQRQAATRQGGGVGLLHTVKEEKRRRWSGWGLQGIGQAQSPTDGKVQLRQQDRRYKSRKSGSQQVTGGSRG